MLDHQLVTRSPVALAERVSVLVFADVDGTGDRQPMVLERDVAWIAECEASVSLLHGGRVVKTEVELVDHTYGFGTCLESAIRDARQACDAYSVTRESTLVVEAKAMVKLTAVLPAPLREERGIRWYREVPIDWIAHRDGAVEAFRRVWSGRYDEEVPPLVRRMKADAVPLATVWSSANSDEENSALLAAFRAKAGVPR